MEEFIPLIFFFFGTLLFAYIIFDLIKVWKEK